MDFDGTGSSDPDGETLRYAWDLDDDGAYDDSTATQPTFTYTTSGTHTASLSVTDSLGASDTDSVTITVGNTPPTATITTPAAGTTWKVGDVIKFTGSATDAQDGTLPASALKWDRHAVGGGGQVRRTRGRWCMMKHQVSADYHGHNSGGVSIVGICR